MVFFEYMQITTRHWVAVGVGFIIAALAFFTWSYRAKAPAFVPPESTSTATTTTENSASVATTAVVPVAYTGSFPINPADTIALWDFTGAYTGNDTLIARANADSAKLAALLGKGEYDDYDLYIGLGNNANLIGDGRTAYQNYNRAIAVHPAKGLAYANLAHLMDELGAYRTAADAYAKTVAVEPNVLEYHLERLSYLTRQFPKDTARIISALADAAKQFGDNASILAIEAQWLSGQGRYADAIAAWERAKMLSPGRDMSAIDAEIARLQAKQ